MIVAGIDIERKYHIEEIISMYNRGLLKPIALVGYGVRADSDGMVGFVPWTETAMFRQEHGVKVREDITPDLEQMREEVERDHPIVRTTPQAKQARVAKRIASNPVLAESAVASVLEESWRRGQAVTGTDIQAAAAKLLTRAEQDNKEADSHRITRAHKT